MNLTKIQPQTAANCIPPQSLCREWNFGRIARRKIDETGKKIFEVCREQTEATLQQEEAIDQALI